MKPKERVLAALGRERPDRVPIDYSAVPEVTGRLGTHFVESDGTYRDMWGVREGKGMIDIFFEIGADIIDPVQVRAHGMEIEALKAAFGERIVFHGAIDQQHLLPFEPERRVREEVRKTIGTLGSRGGYLLGSSHDLLANIPTANILAMYEEAAATR